jgi:hypothetical protein
MQIRAHGWSRSVYGWQTIAEINITKSVRREKAGRLERGKTYVERPVEGSWPAEGNFAISNLARLLELFFKDRSADDVWQFMARVFRGRKRRSSKAKRTSKRKAPH